MTSSIAPNMSVAPKLVLTQKRTWCFLLYHKLAHSLSGWRATANEQLLLPYCYMARCCCSWASAHTVCPAQFRLSFHSLYGVLPAVVQSANATARTAVAAAACDVWAYCCCVWCHSHHYCCCAGGATAAAAELQSNQRLYTQCFCCVCHM